MIRILAVLAACVMASGALAQERRPSHCISLAAAPGIEYLHQASYHAPVSEGAVRLRYVAHAMYLLTTPGGMTAVTDYAGFLGTEEFTPTIATMNHAHSSHWTALPDENIAHLLKGWGTGGGPVEHYLDLGEILVRNVSTDIRSSFGDGVEAGGNSIFIFEVAGLCIGHLGHLHHEPSPEQYAAIGRLDVVMAPVDGGMTVPTHVMVKIIKRLKSSIVLPMHWFSGYSLEQFLEGMADEFEIVRTGEHEITVSLDRLPARPTIMVLQPRYLGGASASPGGGGFDD